MINVGSLSTIFDTMAWSSYSSHLVLEIFWNHKDLVCFVFTNTFHLEHMSHEVVQKRCVHLAAALIVCINNRVVIKLSVFRKFVHSCSFHNIIVYRLVQ